MYQTDWIAAKVKRAVDENDSPQHIHPRFGEYDIPIANFIKYPEAYRVENVGWDYLAKEFSYVLCDRFQGTDSLIVVKQSKLQNPLARHGSKIVLYKFKPGTDLENLEEIDRVFIETSAVATVRCIRAVRKEKEQQQPSQRGDVNAGTAGGLQVAALGDTDTDVGVGEKHYYEYVYELEHDRSDVVTIASETEMELYLTLCDALDETIHIY